MECLDGLAHLQAVLEGAYEAAAQAVFGVRWWPIVSWASVRRLFPPPPPLSPQNSLSEARVTNARVISSSFYELCPLRQQSWPRATATMSFAARDIQR